MNRLDMDYQAMQKAYIEWRTQRADEIAGGFNLSEIAEYTKHLYAEDLEGYLQLAHIPNGVKGGFESVYITGQPCLNPCGR